MKFGIYPAGVFALATIFSSSAQAQLSPDLGLDGLLDPVVEVIAPAIDPVLGHDAPLNEIVYVIGDTDNVDITVLEGSEPTHVPLSDTGFDLPGATVNLPDDRLSGLPESPDVPDLDVDEGGYPVIVNNFVTTNPGTLVGPGPQPRIVVVPGGTARTVASTASSRSNSSGTIAQSRSNKLRMLLGILQNCEWLRFAAGNGVCLPPFAVTQVREMLNSREERQLNDLIAGFAEDIATMRSMMANCDGTRLNPGDINRVIGVGVTSNGAPVLYVL